MVRAMLSMSLEAVIAQSLLKRKSGGRVAAHEILLGTPAIRNLIREGKVPQISSMMQMGTKMGMTTMKDTLFRLLDQDIIDHEEAREVLIGNEEGGDEKMNNRRGGSGGQPAGSSF
jgi:twitching motility protein PilT